MAADRRNTGLLAILIGTGAVATVVVADLLNLVSLSGNVLQVLLAVLLLPWAGVYLSRRNWHMAIGLGLIGFGNLAAIGPPTFVVIGVASIVCGAAVVLAKTVVVDR